MMDQSLHVKERKRLQNRLAQRTYRRNQKERMKSLEQAVKQQSQPQASSISGKEEAPPPPPPLPVQPATDPMTPISHTSLTDKQPLLWDFTLPNIPDPQLNASEWDFPPLTLLPTENPSSSSPSSVEGGEGGVGTGLSGSRPESSRTALHLAVCSGNEPITRLLLSQGADPRRQDGDGQTALHLAVERGYDRIVDILLQSTTTTTTTTAATAGDGDVHDNSCCNGVDVKDSMGRTALFLAVWAGNQALVRRLLEAKADVDRRDERGEVALHWAVKMGGEEGKALVRLLLEFGADVDA